MNIIAMKTNSTFGIYDPFGRRESERKDNRKEKKTIYIIFFLLGWRENGRKS